MPKISNLKHGNFTLSDESSKSHRLVLQDTDSLKDVRFSLKLFLQSLIHKQFQTPCNE